MENNFNLKNFLVENKLTKNAKSIHQQSATQEQEDFINPTNTEDQAKERKEYLDKVGMPKHMKEQSTLPKEVDLGSIELDGVYPSDYPDFADAYISHAKYTDGTELSDDELEILQDEMAHDIGQMAYESLFEGLTEREKALKEEILRTLK